VTPNYSKHISDALVEILEVFVEQENLASFQRITHMVIKGTDPRDFSPQLFIMKNISLGP
jgi:hypothetical protein